MKFEIGDLILWDSVLGSKTYTVIDIWDTSEPKQLLVKDIEILEKCFIVLLCDCTLVSKGNVETKTFKRRIETAKPIVEHIIGSD